MPFYCQTCERHLRYAPYGKKFCFWPSIFANTGASYFTKVLNYLHGDFSMKFISNMCIHRRLLWVMRDLVLTFSLDFSNKVIASIRAKVTHRGGCDVKT